MVGMTLRALVICVVAIAARTAAADAWYFAWHCQSTSQGDCGATGASGTEGPFDSDGACEVAQNRVLLRVNGPGNAGTVSACRDSGSTSSPSSSGAPTRPARFDRWMLGAIAGVGYEAAYTNGTTPHAAKQVGGQIELVLGPPQIGLSIFGGVERDDGTAPDATTVATPMWILDFGVGIVASPFAVVTRPGLEIRPELGIYGVELERLGCDRCTTDGPLGTQMPAESSSAFGGRLRAGLDIYWGADRTHGLALDALIQLVHFGDASDPLSNAVITPPRVLFRLSYVSRRLD